MSLIEDRERINLEDITEFETNERIKLWNELKDNKANCSDKYTKGFNLNCQIIYFIVYIFVSPIYKYTSVFKHIFVSINLFIDCIMLNL